MMSILFRAPQSAIEKAMQKLKEHGGISGDATFQYDKMDVLRKEIFYRDFDFLHMAEIKSLLRNNSVPDVENLDKGLVNISLERLKKQKFISEDAFFNYENLNKLSDKVYYRDFHFLYYLGEYGDEEIVDSALELLIRNNLVPDNATYSNKAYESLRKEVKPNFKIPDTAFSTSMERLLYMLSSVKKPEKVIGLGTFCGYTFLWVIGASCSTGKVYEAQRAYGIDIDKDATNIAIENFKSLTGVEHVQFIAEDGFIFSDNINEEFDYIFLDVDAKDIGKGPYLPLLKILYSKLKKGRWVLAHDTTLPAFKNRLNQYIDFVRDKRYFTESISFDIDVFDLELSIK